MRGGRRERRQCRVQWSCADILSSCWLLTLSVSRRTLSFYAFTCQQWLQPLADVIGSVHDIPSFHVVLVITCPWDISCSFVVLSCHPSNPPLRSAGVRYSFETLLTRCFSIRTRSMSRYAYSLLRSSLAANHQSMNEQDQKAFKLYGKLPTKTPLTMMQKASQVNPLDKRLYLLAGPKVL